MLKSLAFKAANLTYAGLSIAASWASTTHAQQSSGLNFPESSAVQASSTASHAHSTSPVQSAQPTRSSERAAQPTPQSGSNRIVTAKSSPREHPPVETPARSLRDVRVLVAESESMQIATSSPAVIRNANGDAIARLQPNQVYWASQNAQGIQIGNGQLADELWIETNNGLIWINDRWYEGQVHLINTEQSLLAINAVNLERYLMSVVGAEMPSDWSPEALKAQAIAARSYAVALMQQPLSNWYDLVNDERSQVYRGLESVTATTIAAVEATQHQVLVQDGKILLAEYASTEEVTRDAHAGKGMSQTTAQNLATAGASHLQVLGQFYRGAAISTLL